ncbi:site-specific integrase [Thermovorax subterraneus]|nr:site-specific integrase [Thermovorax subterraneus]
MQVLRLNPAPATWKEALEEFLFKKQAEGISKRTIEDYQEHVARFFTQYPNSWPNKLKPAVYEYMAKPKSPAYYNLCLVYLRAFFQYCLEEGYIASNPLSGFKRKKAGDRFINLDLNSIKALLELPDRKTYCGLRDYALILLTLDTGIRPSEALSLKVEDVNLKAGIVNIRPEIAKTRMQRTLPISPAVVEAIKELIKARPEEWKDAPLFCSQDGLPMRERSWANRVQKYGKKLGIKLRAYDLRHVSATWYLRNGGNIHGLRVLLGHTDLHMAKKYVHFVEADIAQEHKQASVVNKLITPRNKRAPRKLV